MIKVLVVDDHSIVRQGMVSLLAAVHPDWKISQAENGVQAILTASRFRPDLILIDYMMPKLDGIKASSIITRDLPGSRIIMVTMSDMDDLMSEASEAGINRIIAKDAPQLEILQTVSELAKEISNQKASYEGKSMDVASKQIKPEKPPERQPASRLLSARESEIVNLMLKGFTSTKISDHLGISKRTVEGHKLKIMRKYKFHSSSDLLRHFLNK